MADILNAYDIQDDIISSIMNIDNNININPNN